MDELTGYAALPCLESVADREIRRLRAELTRVMAERDSLKLQAEMHAQEARTQRATVHEIYQVLTGATGEPGNWHGAEPARKIMAELAEAAEADVATERARADALQAFKDYVHKRLDDACVPVDPESPHKAAGCRIGGRLDWLLTELARVTEERDTYYQKYADTCSTLASRDKEHCKDCCCARSWKALGIAEYTGKSIPEHIEELKSERDHWKRYALKGCE